jgi:RNA polymerase sigma-70 factor (ECF subfamily)
LLSLDQPLPPHPALMSDRAAGPEAQAVESEQEEMVQALLEELQEDYRQAVVLRYWYDLSYDEIAEVMDTTVSAIKSRLFRARRQLAEISMERGIVPALQPEAG